MASHTPYEQLINQPGAIRRGRPSTLTAEQKAQRKEEQKRKTRIRNEARRRAHLVLQHRYNAEYQTLLDQELKALESDKDYAAKS